MSSSYTGVQRKSLDRVLDQLHETIIHMELLMAVHQRVSGIIGNEFYFHGIERHDVDDVLHQAADGSFADAGYFKRMPVQVHRMLVAAAIAKDQSVPFALLDHQRIDVGPRPLVDRPDIELRARLRAVVAE